MKEKIVALTIGPLTIADVLLMLWDGRSLLALAFALTGAWLLRPWR